MKLPYAASTKTIGELFGFSQSTIRRWDEQGYLTRLKAPTDGDGRGAAVRYVVEDFIRFLRAQPGSREGRFDGRRFASMGDVLR